MSNLSIIYEGKQMKAQSFLSKVLLDKCGHVCRVANGLAEYFNAC